PCFFPASLEALRSWRSLRLRRVADCLPKGAQLPPQDSRGRAQQPRASSPGQAGNSRLLSSVSAVPKRRAKQDESILTDKTSVAVASGAGGRGWIAILANGNDNATLRYLPALAPNERNLIWHPSPEQPRQQKGAAWSEPHRGLGAL